MRVLWKPGDNPLTTRLAIACPPELKMSMRLHAVSQIQIDKALVGDAFIQLFDRWAGTIVCNNSTRRGAVT
jgi:hypothetical protein